MAFGQGLLHGEPSSNQGIFDSASKEVVGEPGAATIHRKQSESAANLVESHSYLIQRTLFGGGGSPP
jgi:hypothetical protein